METSWLWTELVLKMPGLFSEITKEWSGQPLVSLEAIVELIRGTNTKTGLRVSCKLVSRVFPTGQKVSDLQMRSGQSWPAIASMSRRSRRA